MKSPAAKAAVLVNTPTNSISAAVKVLVFAVVVSITELVIRKTTEPVPLSRTNRALSVVIKTVSKPVIAPVNVPPVAIKAASKVAYVDAMADAYLAADLIIGRSGAVTCSEFRALGRYALFVPLPIGNGEQFVNAASLVEDNRAQVINQKDFTAEYLKAHISDLLVKSANAPIQGNDADLHAAEKIVALTEFAMKP